MYAEMMRNKKVGWHNGNISLTVFMDVSLDVNSLFHLSSSSFRACMLALWYMYILRGFCLITLGLQLFMITAMPLIPGTTVDLSTRVGFVVKNKSNVLFILVGPRTTCSSPKSLAISINCFDRPGAAPPGFVLSMSQSISGRLKSPASHIYSLSERLILLMDSRSSFI